MDGELKTYILVLENADGKVSEFYAGNEKKSH